MPGSRVIASNYGNFVEKKKVIGVLLFVQW